MIQVVKAEYCGEYRVCVEFNDGAAGVADLKDVLWGPVFEPLRDVEMFRKFKVGKGYGTIVWENGADIAPEALYERAVGKSGLTSVSGDASSEAQIYPAESFTTASAEVVKVSPNGIWLLLNGSETFLPFDRFPWFREASIGKIIHVEMPSPDHLYWPELDVELEVESVLHPDRYPLVNTVHEKVECYVPEKPGKTWDEDKVDDAVLALLQLTLHDDWRAWKGFDFDVMNRLFEKGYIFDPRNKNKSVALTQKGLLRSKELFEELFGTPKC